MQSKAYGTVNNTATIMGGARWATLELLNTTQFQESATQIIWCSSHIALVWAFRFCRRNWVSLFQSFWALFIVWDSCGCGESVMFIRSTFTAHCGPCPSIGFYRWPGMVSKLKRAGHLDARLLGLQVLNSDVVMEKPARKPSQHPLNY